MRSTNTPISTTPKRPGAAPGISADMRPGHPSNAAAQKPVTRFSDWALI
ncbi:hypothetical protein [Roseinatronobacter sp. NSM]